ncbi:unnamed protein product [Brachionus calyciflorus]|uniref:MULE transposase domain-containing protein n=1 Tax=Brachionus calyciflorus TaxID=104777 RepID=A0A813YI39_9BILA|nr:unnamed protein product [Brachionus calyciflorus]
MSNDQVQFIKNNLSVRGKNESKDILVYQNHQYWFKEANDKTNTTRYVCCQKTKNKCFATITIRNNDKSIKRYNDNHTCNAMLSEAKVAANIAKQELKMNVHGNKSKSLRECYNEAQRNLMTQNIPERAIAAHFPAFSKISSTLTKIRSSNKPPIPEDFSRLQITGDYTKTTANNEFLRYDNQSKTNRLMIFVDDESLKLLSEATDWFMDGTFKCSPKQFMQMYTIHAYLANTTFASVYIFAQKKEEKTYREAIGALKDLATSKNITLNPFLIMADFERASTNAVMHHFPNAVIKGCWFHFRQAIFKRVVKIGLKQFYAKTEYNEFINMFGALALVPIDRIQEGLDIIKQVKPNDAKCDQLLSYFENQWLKNIQPKIWNHFDSVVRTNNRDQQTSTYIDYLRTKQGTLSKEQSKNDSEKDLIYSLFKVEFSSTNDFKEYFHGISYHIRYPYAKILDVDSQDDFIQVQNQPQNQAEEQPQINNISEYYDLPDLDLNISTGQIINVEQAIFSNREEIQQSESANLTTLNDVIGEANDILYSHVDNFIEDSYVLPVVLESNKDQSDQDQSIRINRLIPLHERLALIDDDSESDEEFNYMDGIRDKRVLDTMYREKQDEREALEANIQRRADALSSQDIVNEVHNYWKSSNLKRKNVTADDLKYATNRLKKRFRAEETATMHLDFRERYKHLL